MFKTLTAIVLNLLLVASPAHTLMADDMNGFSNPPPDKENTILLVIGIDATLTDENCYGYGAYRLYRPDMAVSIRTTDGFVYDSVHPAHTLMLDNGRCNYVARLKIPVGIRFYVSIAGVAIPPELYQISQEEDNVFFANISDVNLSDLLSKGLGVGD